MPFSHDGFKFLAGLPQRIRKDELFIDFDCIKLKADVLTHYRKKITSKARQAPVKKMIIELKDDDLNPVEQNFTDLSPHMKQAEVVLSIRAAVDAVCRHFDKTLGEFLDYKRDRSRSSLKEIVIRAKVLEDFEDLDTGETRTYTDEIIEICDQSDERYWLGKSDSDGHMRWFPSSILSRVSSKPD